jgi:CRP-like cAMP-binding protein
MKNIIDKYFSPESAELLLARGKPASLRARRTLVREGTPGAQVYLLTSGAVRVMRGARSSGKGALLWLATAPALLGVEEALMDTPSVHDIMTVEPSSAIAIPAELFRELAVTDRVLRDAISRMLAERIVRLSGRAASMKACVTETRLAQLLLDYAELCGAPSTGSIELRFRLSQEMLAQDLQVSRRVVGPALASLRRARLVEKKAGRYTIVDLAALARYADPSSGRVESLDTTPQPMETRASA